MVSINCVKPLLDEARFAKLDRSTGSYNSSAGCPTDDETIEDYWSAITNLTVINQSAGKGVKIHSESPPEVLPGQAHLHGGDKRELFGDGTLVLTMAKLTTQQHIIKVLMLLQTTMQEKTMRLSLRHYMGFDVGPSTQIILHLESGLFV